MDATVALVCGGRMPGEVELSADTATVIVRALPLLRRPDGRGARWCWSATSPSCKRRERALLSKDATIREIHHRVKNNLQTVAALLRLQSRRLEDPGAAAALAEAERRVGAIAVVHDLLAQASTEEVPFDDGRRPAGDAWSTRPRPPDGGPAPDRAGRLVRGGVRGAGDRAGDGAGGAAGQRGRAWRRTSRARQLA